eukprot:926947-Pleurochrysis_carterae.AAC.1
MIEIERLLRIDEGGGRAEALESVRGGLSEGLREVRKQGGGEREGSARRRVSNEVRSGKGE